MEDLLHLAGVLEDPRVRVLVLLWLILEVRVLRRKAAALFTGHGAQELRIAALERHAGIPATPAAHRG